MTIRWFEGREDQQGERQSKLVGEWLVANPAYQPPASWAAEPLPLTRTNGPVRCTLERVLFGLAAPATRTNGPNGSHLHFGLAGDGDEAAAVLVPRLTADSAAAKWVVGSVTLHDVSGNEVRREPLWLKVDDACSYFTPALWPAGTWEVNLFAKQQVPFHLPVSESFSPEELLIFKDVELPGPGTVALNQELERNGARVRLTQFTLRPPKNVSEPWFSEDASKLRATLLRSTEGAVHVDFAGVTDDHGEAHYPRAHGYGTGGRSVDLDLNYSFPTLPLETRKLTITFVVQRGREFIFHVKPEIAGAAVSLP